MLSHSGSVTVSVSLLTSEGKYTFSGYLRHVPCFGICLSMQHFVWEHAVQRGGWTTWVIMGLGSSRL